MQEVPVGLVSLRAEECGECHVDIYEEWRATTHAQAFEDRQFQAEWKKDDELWLCLNCHTPLQNQQERVVRGLVDGDFRRPATEAHDRFDPVLRDESITCAVCHVRDGAVLGPGLGGDPPHPVRVARELLPSQALCESCHNMSDRLTETLVCTFTTGDEWRAAGMQERGTGCADCHMPPVARPLVVGGEVKPGHRHTWFGAGIAKRSDDLAAVRDGYLPGYDVDVEAHRAGGPSNDIAIRVAITNARAGHELPTGDPERFVTLEVAVLDDHGTRLWTETARIGEAWEWYPQARLMSDNSLEPGERRELTFDAKKPAGVDDPLTVELVVRNHRMTEENARAMGILGQYPLAVETVRRRVPVGEVQQPD